MIYDLPKSLEINGREWSIRTDYRDILTIISAFGDDDLSNQEKVYICLYILYEDFEDIPPAEYQAFYDTAMEFIDHGTKGNKNGPRTMDWEQDAPLIFPAVNRSAGFEVRAVDYMHWWTFTGYFMEIKDTTYSTILALRNKKARGKKLEKDEREFWQQNQNVCVLGRKKLTADEKAEKERLKALLG